MFVYFHPLEEGFGLGILEALILDVPVVSFKNVILSELGVFTMSREHRRRISKQGIRAHQRPAVLSEAHQRLRDSYELLKKTFDLGEMSRKLRDVLAGLQD